MGPIWLAATAFGGPDVYGVGDGSDGPLVAGVGTTVNVATPLALPAVGGDTTLTVSDPTLFAVGDLVIVWQTTDPTVSLSDVSSSAVGGFEWARITGVAAETLTLDAGLVDDAPLGAQVVRIPEYTDVTVDVGATLVAVPWNGAAGGIVAFAARGTVSLEGEITADGAGFRGGEAGAVPGSGCTDPHDPASGAAGETVDGQLGTLGPAASATGGGGGGCEGAGGGGGGGFSDPELDAGPGGDGGWTSVNEPGGGSRPEGGRGGSPVVFAGSDGQRILPGGGGGAGDDGGAGGAGGGVVLIRALSFDGDGDLSAHGAPGEGSVGGGGGGGAGGSVLVVVADGFLGCGRATAVGGDGGTAGAGFGPGGGGGGGRVSLGVVGGIGCATPPGSSRSGTQPDPDAPGGASHGAEDGSYVSVNIGISPWFVNDVDGDGWFAEIDDCDDTDAAVHPLAADDPADGLDGDCDGTDPCWADADGDGHGEEDAVPSADADCDDPGEASVNDDRCPGFDDDVDTDGDDVPDGCDTPGTTTPPTTTPDDTPPSASPGSDEPGGCGCAHHAGPGPALVALVALVVLRRRSGLVVVFAGCHADPVTAEPVAGDDDDDDDTGVSSDADGDGFLVGVDCNDADPAIHPEAPERCADDVDNDCDGVIDCALEGPLHVGDLAIRLPVGGGDSWLAGDVDGDGAEDLWLGSPYEGQDGVAVLLLGPVDRQSVPVLTFTSRRGTNPAGVGDFTNDGVPDLVASSVEGVFVLDGTLRGEVGPEDGIRMTGESRILNVSAPTVWGGPRLLAGDPDHHGPSTVSEAGRLYAAPVPLPPGTEIDVGGIADGWFEGTVANDWIGGTTAVGDLDGDGVDELVLGSGSGLYVADTPPVGAVVVTSLQRIDSAGGWFGDLQVADLDGDGRDDLVTSWVGPYAGPNSFQHVDIRAWLGMPANGADVETADVVADVPDERCAIRSLSVGDLDQSGEADLWIDGDGCAPDERAILGMYGPLLAGTYDLPRAADVILGASPGDPSVTGPVQVADLTGDGVPDLLLGEEQGRFQLLPQ